MLARFDIFHVFAGALLGLAVAAVADLRLLDLVENVLAVLRDAVAALGGALPDDQADDADNADAGEREAGDEQRRPDTVARFKLVEKAVRRERIVLRGVRRRCAALPAVRLVCEHRRGAEQRAEQQSGKKRRPSFCPYRFHTITIPSPPRLACGVHSIFT